MFNGDIKILKLTEKDFNIIFMPSFGAGSCAAQRCHGENEVSEFLRELLVQREAINSALRDLDTKSSATVHNVSLTDDQVLTYGLDSTVLRQLRQGMALAVPKGS